MHSASVQQHSYIAIKICYILLLHLSESKDKVIPHSVWWGWWSVILNLSTRQYGSRGWGSRQMRGLWLLPWPGFRVVAAAAVPAHCPALYQHPRAEVRAASTTIATVGPGRMSIQKLSQQGYFTVCWYKWIFYLDEILPRKPMSNSSLNIEKSLFHFCALIHIGYRILCLD